MVFKPEICREKAMKWWNQRLEWSSHKPKKPTTSRSQEKARKDPPWSQRARAPALTSDFQFPELCKRKFLLVEATLFVLLCYGILGNYYIIKILVLICHKILLNLGLVWSCLSQLKEDIKIQWKSKS